MKHLSRIGYLSAIGLSVYACQNPLKDVELRFIDPLPTAVELRLNPEGGVFPKPLTIKVAGPNASAVVTPLKNTKFKLGDDGRLYLSLSPSITPTSNNPIRFTVVATADSAYDVVYPVVLNSSTERVVSEELLRKPTKLPIVEVTGVSSEAGLLDKAITAQTPSLNAGGGPTQLSIPAGAQLKDPQGGLVSGALTFRLKQLDIRSTAQFAGNGVIFQPLDASGKPSPTQQLATIVGGVRILGYNDDFQLIKSFDKPARLAFLLNPQLINPRTKSPVQAGDAISLLSYDATLGQWQQETPGSVVRNAQNELEYVATVTHFSDWVAAFTTSTCESGPVFKVNSPIPPGNLLYHCQVIDATTNLPLPNTSGNTDFYTTITNGRTLQLYYLPLGSKVKLKVYDSQSNTVVMSSVVDGCSTAQVLLNLTAFTPPKNPPVAVTVALQFPCTSLNADKLPAKAVYTQFKETGTAAWHDLPVMRYEAGKTEFSIMTYDVKIGKTYDLQAGFSPGRYTISQTAQLIDSNKWIVRIKTHDYCN